MKGHGFNVFGKGTILVARGREGHDFSRAVTDEVQIAALVINAADSTVEERRLSAAFRSKIWNLGFSPKPYRRTGFGKGTTLVVPLRARSRSRL